MYQFYNRSQAGKQLVSHLRKYQDIPGVVLAVPRGGIPVAFEVAKALKLPLEVVLVKKIGHPYNPEYAIGAVSLKDSFIIPHEDVNPNYIQGETEKVRRRLWEMKQLFYGDREPERFDGKTVIIVDDGVATGNTLLATIHILRKNHPAKIVIAVPVISRSAAHKLSPEVDELIALLTPETFYGVSTFYHDFSQLTDEEVMKYLHRLHDLRKPV